MHELKLQFALEIGSSTMCRNVAMEDVTTLGAFLMVILLCAMVGLGPVCGVLGLSNAEELSLAKTVLFACVFIQDLRLLV